MSIMDWQCVFNPISGAAQALGHAASSCVFPSAALNTPHSLWQRATHVVMLLVWFYHQKREVWGEA